VVARVFDQLDLDCIPLKRWKEDTQDAQGEGE
jgi:3-polyprenyl-4-hydroxybenzoate decarboxylase